MEDAVIALMIVAANIQVTSKVAVEGTKQVYLYLPAYTLPDELDHGPFSVESLPPFYLSWGGRSRSEERADVQTVLGRRAPADGVEFERHASCCPHRILDLFTKTL